MHLNIIQKSDFLSFLLLMVTIGVIISHSLTIFPINSFFRLT